MVLLYVLFAVSLICWFAWLICFPIYRKSIEIPIFQGGQYVAVLMFMTIIVNIVANIIRIFA